MPPTNEEALFALAVAKPVGERTAWLDGKCGDGKALLAANEQPDTLPAKQADTARPTIALKFAEEPKDEALGQTLGRYKLLERVG